MNILHLLGKDAGIVISAIGVIISALALIQGSIRKNSGKSPLFFYIVAAASIILVFITTMSYFLVGHPLEDGISENTQMQDSSVDKNVNDQADNMKKRIVLTSCSINENEIYGTYTFVNFEWQTNIKRGGLFYISNESNWVDISDKLSFSSNDQEFVFQITERLPDGDYACEFEYLCESETFTIEIHFEVENGCFYGKSCNEIYSDGTFSEFTGEQDLRDRGL